MRVQEADLPGVLLIEPTVHRDRRGAFLEAWAQPRFREAGLPEFVQDNVSVSYRGVLRGLHLQHPHGQGKLVQVLSGSVYDVAVDVRVGSPWWGRWVGVTLDDQDFRQMYVPPGFAHGFAVQSEVAVFTYKCTESYHPDSEVGVAWNDPDIGIEWPCETPVLSARDAALPMLREIDAIRLPGYR